MKCFFSLLYFCLASHAFVTPPRGGRGGKVPPDSKGPRHLSTGGDDYNSGISPGEPLHARRDTNRSFVDYDDMLLLRLDPELRGGSTSTKSNPLDQTKQVVAGSKSTWETTAAFWSDAMQSFVRLITSPVRAIQSRVGKSDKKNEQQQLISELLSIKIKSVQAPNSTVLPREVVDLAAHRSGVIGNTLGNEPIQGLSRALKLWYTRNGYILHSLDEVTLDPESATLKLQLQEPRVSEVPVNIITMKTMVVDPESGQVMSFRQYKDKQSQRGALATKRIDMKKINRTLVPTDGRTKPRRIASALNLKPGKHFKWSESRWQSVENSGIFSRVWDKAPKRMSDGTVQLQVMVTEPAPRNLHCGITNSLYTGSWEGEVELDIGNILGGGEMVGALIRKGTKDSEPSIHLKYVDDKLGMKGGYTIEAFNDYIGHSPGKGGKKKEENKEDEILDASTLDGNLNNDLLSRKGISFRLRSPIPTEMVRSSSACTLLERTTTRTGKQENIGSATLELGPFRRDLPMDARSSVQTGITAGARWQDEESSSRLLPFTRATATTRQIFPIFSATRPILLALQHTISGSTPHLPTHEAVAAGIKARVRGYGSHGPLSSSIVGTTELRIPVALPVVKSEGTFVVFGDWVVAKRPTDEVVKRSSIGVGFRKNIQGIPIQYDLSYNGDGKIGSFLNIASDFDA